jgi:hypothetical protein
MQVPFPSFTSFLPSFRPFRRSVPFFFPLLLSDFCFRSSKIYYADRRGEGDNVQKMLGTVRTKEGRREGGKWRGIFLTYFFSIPLLDLFRWKSLLTEYFFIEIFPTTSSWKIGTKIHLLAEIVYWATQFSYWRYSTAWKNAHWMDVPPDWTVCTGTSHYNFRTDFPTTSWKIGTGINLLTEIVHWDFPTTIFVLTLFYGLKNATDNPSWLKSLCWNFPTTIFVLTCFLLPDWTVCTGTSPLQFSYWLYSTAWKMVTGM